MTRRTELAVWGWAALVTVVTVLVTLVLADLDVDLATDSPWPFWVAAAIMFAVQSMRINIATTGGRHVIVLSELLLAVGLFHVRPDALVIGAVVGAAPAFLLIRTAPIKLAVNLAHAGLWTAVPALAFHLGVREWAQDALVAPTPLVAWLVFGACVMAFVGATLAIRVPLGLITGIWWVTDEERRELASSSVVALGASALAIVGVLLAHQSAWLLALLALPVVQILLAIQSQARSVDQRAALDFTVEASQRLRLAEDVPLAMRQLLGDFRYAFGVERAALLLELPGSALRITADETGVHEGFRGEGALRAWLATRRPTGPAVRRRDETLAPFGEEIDAPELLVAPLSVRAATGAVVLAGRPLGAFGSDHVELVRTFTAAASSALHRHLISRELDEAEHREAELERRVSRDALTGLYNRSAFERDLVAALLAGDDVTVGYVDLDGFKEVNDLLGHAAGDLVLVEAARRMRDALGRGHVAARLGGDEFGLLFHTDDQGLIREIANRTLEALARPVPGVSEVTAISATIGIASARPGENPAAIIARADAAMYEAKRAGGHRIATADV